MRNVCATKSREFWGFVGGRSPFPKYICINPFPTTATRKVRTMFVKSGDDFREDLRENGRGDFVVGREETILGE